jgi:predicted ATPase
MKQTSSTVIGLCVALLSSSCLIPSNAIRNTFHKQPSPTSNKYIISGGPCVGKTSLITYFASHSLQTVPEAYASLFEEARAQGTLGSFFADPIGLRQRLIAKQHMLENSCNPMQLTLLDRSMVDIIFYADYFNTTLPATLINEASKATYNQYVFFLEPLPEELYIMNDRRGEDRTEALKMHYALKQSYQRYGYTIINVPFDTVEHRALHIMSFIQHLAHTQQQ